MWFPRGTSNGVAVITTGDWRVLKVPAKADVHSVYPVQISGPESFHILCVWSKSDPSYVSSIWNGLNHYQDFARAAPTVIAGDFNSHSRFDRFSGKLKHSTLVERLRTQFQVTSAWHATNCSDSEPPTFHMHNCKTKPYHIDYCFIPEKWVRGAHVSVGRHDDWQQFSDHCPIAVEIATSEPDLQHEAATITPQSQFHKQPPLEIAITGNVQGSRHRSGMDDTPAANQEEDHMETAMNKRIRGSRRPSDNGRYINILLEDDLIERIDDFRFSNRMPSRTESVRWLIEWALEQKPRVQIVGGS